MAPGPSPSHLTESKPSHQKVEDGESPHTYFKKARRFLIDKSRTHPQGEKVFLFCRLRSNGRRRRIELLSPPSLPLPLPRTDETRRGEGDFLPEKELFPLLSPPFLSPLCGRRPRSVENCPDSSLSSSRIVSVAPTLPQPKRKEEPSGPISTGGNRVSGGICGGAVRTQTQSVTDRKGFRAKFPRGEKIRLNLTGLLFSLSNFLLLFSVGGPKKRRNSREV